MITIYTMPTCNKCATLKKLMKEKNILFQECSDMEVFERLGIMSVPYLLIDEELLDFSLAYKWIKTQGE